ncbi:MAG: CDP-alcohol phosphatidyltransferase family protein [Psychroflexus sp.]|jgi:CDP-diacylglycerol--serine O-phosphatidyltransferase|nr:CDP-alcohol phosphatidyltransferase family protein [Psychroflexus sp.]MDR9448244.1 CDP-alcohol phosphatidyltransferase family protein [Psychroflexus sp.]
MKQGFKKFIPHCITLLNLLSGCVAVYQVSIEAYYYALGFVLLGVFFDFFDGLAARKLGVTSAIGVQLDSLADLITSGVVPGFILFQLIKLGLADFEANFFVNFLPYLGFIITAATAYRLAVFNIKSQASSDFTGLAAPANAIMIVSWPLMIAHSEIEVIPALFQHPVFLFAFVFVDVFLLNGRFKLFSFKLDDLSFQKNAFRYFFILASLILLLALTYEAFTLIIPLYFLISYFHFKQKKSASV